VLACRRWARAIDVSTVRIAHALGLSARTIRHWASHRGRHTRPGRPAHPITRAEAVVMQTALIVEGSRTSVTALQRWCPTLSRRVIAAWLRADRRRRRAAWHRVRWQRPGRVWALDFSQPPIPIDGRYRQLLHVRDLASQYHLAALPVMHADATTVCGLLRALCAQHAAPLVLKVDNGSPFISGDVRAWARANRVQLLHSPPRCPRYNGTIEASIASITTRTHHAAVAEDHPEMWTCRDLEQARASANSVVRQQPDHTAEDVWRTAPRITAHERHRFMRLCAASRRRRIDQPVRVQQRVAIVDTLRRLGYVSITRRADLVHSLKSKKRQELRA
jgi:transposase InsO family protein